MTYLCFGSLLESIDTGIENRGFFSTHSCFGNTVNGKFQVHRMSKDKAEARALSFVRCATLGVDEKNLPSANEPRVLVGITPT